MEGELRRYDGRTEHADWCADDDHEGLCLDVLMGWEPAHDQIAKARVESLQDKESSDDG